MESPLLEKTITKYLGPSNPEVEKVSYSEKTVWINKVLTIGFCDVPEEVWNFKIGGYQVCEKWLKDRKGRTLSKDDISYYQKIIKSISETINQMHQIDKVIERFGGWNNSFQTVDKKITSIPQGLLKFTKL
jgi:hypothetical protein